MGLFLCTSCGYEETYLPDSPQGRIIATVNAATRTAMGEAEEGANAVGILWTYDDGIGVFEASSASQRCYAKTSDSGNKADIRKYKSDFNDWSGDEQLGADGNYQEVISNLITVYQERLAGMDALIQQGKFTK